MNASAQHRTLTPGVEIPFLGFGTFLIPDADAPAAVTAALSAGYRHIDTAEVYQNERGVGEGLRAGVAENGLSRDDVFITTKLWPESREGKQKSAEETAASLDESLERLGLDHIDLYLIHAPFTKEQRLEQWEALVEAHRSGKARAIGVSNFSSAHIDELIAAGLPAPHADQVELHPWSQKLELVERLDRDGIVPIAYSSLVPLSTWRASTGQDDGKTGQMRADGDREDAPFKHLAAKYGVTEARLLLRWGVQNGYPVLPKSTNPARIQENADLFSFEIDAADMESIRSMDRGPGVAWGAIDPITAP